MSLKAQIIFINICFCHDLTLIKLHDIPRNFNTLFDRIVWIEWSSAGQLIIIMCTCHKNTNIEAFSTCKMVISKIKKLIKTSIEDNKLYEYA